MKRSSCYRQIFFSSPLNPPETVRLEFDYSVIQGETEQKHSDILIFKSCQAAPGSIIGHYFS